jgi:maleate isomerase/arylmalonate decarboxylase
MARDRMAEATVYGRRAKIGVIVPPTNTANEAEWQAMAPAGVSIHAARMKLHTDTTSETGKRELYADIERFAGDLAQAGPDVIVYGCTAGSMVSPVTALPDHMSRATGLPCITTAQSLIEALRALGVSRVAVATPYHDTLNDHEAHFLAEHGIQTVAMAGMGYGAGGVAEYRNIARVPPDEVFEHARAVDRPEAQAILVSCTDFATLGVIDRLERAAGKPAISSNQATLWLALRRAGVADRLAGHGRLFERH